MLVWERFCGTMYHETVPTLGKQNILVSKPPHLSIHTTSCYDYLNLMATQVNKLLHRPYIWWGVWLLKTKPPPSTTRGYLHCLGSTLYGGYYSWTRVTCCNTMDVHLRQYVRAEFAPYPNCPCSPFTHHVTWNGQIESEAMLVWDHFHGTMYHRSKTSWNVSQFRLSLAASQQYHCSTTV